MSGASNFPTSLDTFVDPDASSTCNGTNPTGVVVTHRAMHTLENDAIAALQAKVGIDSSTDASSHDYKIAAALAAILALQGTSLLYGSGAPSAGTGVDGNFYLDETAHVLYGPKAGGAWPAGTSIIGADGANGPPGADGAPGAAATIAVGTVNTLSPGASATVTNSGTSSAAVFDFGIPAGADGAPGANGSDGAGTIYVGTTANSGNAYTATPSPSIGSYGTGTVYIVKFNAANTGAATLNISGQGAKNIYLNGAALTGAEIAANATIALTYDGTQFNMTGDGGGGGAGSGGMVKIAKVVCSGSQSKVTFSSIPATYSDLMITFLGRLTGTTFVLAGIKIKLNSDSTSGNYNGYFVSGNSGSASGSSSGVSSDGIDIANICSSTTPTSPITTGRILIPGYASTASFHKAFSCENFVNRTSANIGQQIMVWGGGWYGDAGAAISQIDLTASSSSFQDGSIFTLYGLG